MSFLNKLFKFVLLTTSKYNIDESHGVSHSMNVLKFASDIYEDEVQKYPLLKKHEQIIYVSAILHDMCDKKYMNQAEGITEINQFLLENMSLQDINTTNMIISTMSYSFVKKNGFPNLGPYKRAYHIVREADLLSAYDFDRCMIYNMHKRNGNIDEAFPDAENIFNTRMFKHNEDGLFISDFSRRQSLILESNALQQIDKWRRLVKKPSLII